MNLKTPGNRWLYFWPDESGIVLIVPLFYHVGIKAGYNWGLGRFSTVFNLYMTMRHPPGPHVYHGVVCGGVVVARVTTVPVGDLVPLRG